MRALAIAIALLLRIVGAIYNDEAGIVDYHLALLGEPGNSTTFFHHPVPGSKASLIYTLSERNVLGAINPKDGSAVWRHLLANDPSTPRGQISTAEGQDVVFTAVNDTAGAWSASDGRFLWAATSNQNSIKDVETLNSEYERNGKTNGDAVALWSGKNAALKRLDAETGVEQWVFEDSSGSVPYRVVALGPDVYLIGLSKAMLKGYKLHITTVDAKTGKAKDQITLSSEGEIASEYDILHVGHVGRLPMIIWTDASRTTLKANIVGSKTIASFDVASPNEPIEAASVHCSRSKSGSPHFLVEFKTSKTHWGQVYHVDAKSDPKKAKVSKAYDLPRLEDRGAFASSVVNDQTFFVRLASEVQLFSSASHGVLARWPLKLPRSFHISQGDWQAVRAASEVVVRGDSTYAIRSAILLDTGDWTLIRNGDVQWSRPEQLSGILNAAWLPTNQSQALVDELEVESDQSPILAAAHRLKRHISLATEMSGLLQALPETVVAWLASFVQNGHAKQHAFGFDKEVYAKLIDGKVVAINPAHPESVRTLDSARSQEVRHILDAPTDTLSPSVQGGYSYKIEEGGLSGIGPSGNLWHLSLSSGQTVLKTISQPAGEKVASIGKVLGDRTVLYKYLNPNAFLVLIKDEAEQQLSVSLLDAISGAVLHTEDHDDVDFDRPIAAFLSENWFSYSFTFGGSKDDLSRGHLLVMGEAYESEFPNDRGPRGASSNFSAIDPSMATPGVLKPHVVSQAYHLPEEISHMAITQTQQGITSKQLLVTLANSNAIVGIPHYMLDPRKPIGKAPTNQEMEEGLTQYAPFIDFDPKMYLTHTNELIGIDNVISSPSDMESTSLVFAYGLDVFGTRVAPSFTFDILGASFNKIQLILTVTALTVAVFAVAPLIKRKQTNALWQNP